MKNTPANPCVIAHFIGRGACVYCRLLSVLLMQIIKFGGKLVVNPHCFSIERHDFKRNKANFRILLVDGLHRRDPFCGSFILDQADVNTIKFSIFQLSPILHIFALL